MLLGFGQPLKDGSWSYWASMATDEEVARGSRDGASEDGALHEHIAHWVEVLDTWVKQVDLGMGRQSGAKARLGESQPHTGDGAGTAKGVEG